MKKLSAKITLFTLAMSVPFTSCGKGVGIESSSKDPSSVKYMDIEVGKDFTDLNAKLTVVTNRTDLIQDTPDGKEFPDYIAEFNKMYPDISVTFEGITDYDTDMTSRLPSTSWGDICCIPSALSNVDLEKYFVPLASYEELKETYEFVDQCMYDGTVYGIPTSGNAIGVVYNKRIWEEAGVTELPETPDEFIADLHLIKDNTDSVPLYTNYHDIWPLVAWDAYVFSIATGNPEYKHYVLPHEKTPFSKRADGTGPYEVYNILYRVVNENLIEDDPVNTSWELSKGALNRGEIATMVLGSWAISQIQGADSNPDDVAYMPFPISVNGVQYSVAIGDYSYGINNKISNDKKAAAMVFIKYMIENSGYAYDQGSIPTQKGGEYPDTLSSFQETVLLKDVPPGDEGEIFTLINDASDVKLEADSAHVIRVVDAAVNGNESFDDIMEDWNKSWNKAQTDNNVTISD